MSLVSRAGQLFLVLACYVYLLDASAKARVVTGSFRGTVEEIVLVGNSAVPGGIAVGHAVEGSFKYDTAATTDVLPQNDTFGSFVFSPPENFLSFRINGREWRSGNHLIINVGDNATFPTIPGQFFDFFSIFFNRGASSFPDDPTPADDFEFAHFVFEEIGPTESNLTVSDSLPLSLANLNLSPTTTFRARIRSGPFVPIPNDYYDITVLIDPSSLTLGEDIPPPDAPKELSAIPGNQMVLLQWADANENLRVAWNVYFREVFPTETPWTLIPGDESGTGIPTSFSQSYLVGDPNRSFRLPLTNESVYQFRVEAVSVVGGQNVFSPFSNVAEATPSIHTETRPAQPVVLVHGFAPNGSFGYWDDLVGYIENTLGWRFGGELAVQQASPILNPEVGFIGQSNPAADVYVVNFRDSQVDNGIAVWGVELRAFLAKINNLRSSNGLLPVRFISVAHSIGGIAARHYLQNDIFQNDIAHLITYGSPHQGTEFSSWALLRKVVCQPIEQFVSGTCADINATSIGLQQLDPDNPAFGFMDGLNARIFPSGTRFTSIIGSRSITFGPITLGGGDGIINATSQNMANLPNPPQTHRAYATRKFHWQETGDVVNIVRAVGHGSPIPQFQGVDDLLINVASPVDIVVTDALGRVISKNSNGIPAAMYEEVEDEFGDRHDNVLIPLASGGKYQIKVVAEGDALPTDTFTLSVTFDEVPTVLTQNQQIRDIAVEPFVNHVVRLGIKARRQRNIIKLENDEVCVGDDDDELLVSVFGTPEFDAVIVDDLTAVLGDPQLSGKATPIRSRIKDVDHDGRDDLLLRFTICDLVTGGGLNQNTASLVLNGVTLEGSPFAGRISVRVLVDDGDDDDDDDESGQNGITFEIE